MPIKSRFLRCVSFIFILLLVLPSPCFAKNGNLMNTYYFLSVPSPNSHDPLDMDEIRNHALADLVYARIIEPTPEGTLVSRILKKFSFEEKENTISWVVAKGLTYEDGHPITVDDVAYSLSRLAFSHPKLPVVEDIDGLDDWLKSSNPLAGFPSGVIIRENEIRVHFRKSVKHALSRLSYHMLAVIPRNSVDLSSNKLKHQPPASGPYRIASQNTEEWIFVLREGFSQFDGVTLPESIRLRSLNPSDFVAVSSSLDDHSVIVAMNGVVSSADVKATATSCDIVRLPTNQTSALYFNPQVEPFVKRECRFFLAEEFRKTFVQLQGQEDSSEGSIFVQMMPGYRELSSLRQGADPLSDRDRAVCLDVFRKHPIRWAWFTKKTTFSQRIMKQTLERLHLPTSEEIYDVSGPEFIDLFLSGKTNATTTGMELSFHDPIDDLRMYMTPGLHSILKPLWGNAELVKKVNALYEEADPEKKRLTSLAINQEWFNSAIFNVYTHGRFDLIVKKGDSKLSLMKGKMGFPVTWRVLSPK